MHEVWLPVPDYADLYSVSNMGRVKSLRSGMILAPTLDHGYPKVSLARDGQKKNFAVHRLVLIAFCGPEPFEGAQAAHNDGNRANPHLCNLRWATPTENQADRVRHGTRCFGADVFGSKLNDNDVSRIRQRLKSGERNKPIAEDYGVSISTVHLIRHNRTWRHIS